MGLALTMVVTFGLLLAALLPRRLEPAWAAPIIAIGYAAAVGLLGSVDHLDWLAGIGALLAAGLAVWSVVSWLRAAWIRSAGQGLKPRMLLMLGLSPSTRAED
jgi:hypothetical protein